MGWLLSKEAGRWGLAETDLRLLGHCPICSKRPAPLLLLFLLSFQGFSTHTPAFAELVSFVCFGLGFPSLPSQHSCHPKQLGGTRMAKAGTYECKPYISLVLNNSPAHSYFMLRQSFGASQFLGAGTGNLACKRSPL